MFDLLNIFNILIVIYYPENDFKNKKNRTAYGLIQN